MKTVRQGESDISISTRGQGRGCACENVRLCMEFYFPCDQDQRASRNGTGILTSELKARV